MNNKIGGKYTSSTIASQERGYKKKNDKDIADRLAASENKNVIVGHPVAAAFVERMIIKFTSFLRKHVL